MNPSDNAVRYPGHDRESAALASVADVMRLIVESTRPGPVVRLPLREALHCVAAEAVGLTADFPPFDKAVMDGYAVRAADTAGAAADSAGPRVMLDVVGEIEAGPRRAAVVGGAPVRAAAHSAAAHSAASATTASVGAGQANRIESGQAIRINTGAPMPDGADAVVMVERTRPAGDESARLARGESASLSGDESARVAGSARRVEILRAVQRGENVTPVGRVRRAGDRVIAAGERLTPTRIAAAAAAGCGELAVFEPPAVAIVSTGNEVLPPGAERVAGCIYDSNGPGLAAMVRAAGARPVQLPICRDDRAELAACFRMALQHPIMVVAGGMAVGTKDLAPAVLRELGVEWKVHGVNLRPGRPMAFGRGPAGQQVFGLPGNPASCLVCFQLFVRLALQRMLGMQVTEPPTVSAVLARAVKAGRDPRPAYVPAQLQPARLHSAQSPPAPPQSAGQGHWTVDPVAWHGSDDPFGLADANALLVRMDGSAEIPAGAAAPVIPLDWHLNWTGG